MKTLHIKVYLVALDKSETLVQETGDLIESPSDYPGEDIYPYVEHFVEKAFPAGDLECWLNDWRGKQTDHEHFTVQSVKLDVVQESGERFVQYEEILHHIEAWLEPVK